VSALTSYLSHRVHEAAGNVLEDLALHQREDGWIPPASMYWALLLSVFAASLRPFMQKPIYTPPIRLPTLVGSLQWRLRSLQWQRIVHSDILPRHGEDAGLLLPCPHECADRSR